MTSVEPPSTTKRRSAILYTCIRIIILIKCGERHPAQIIGRIERRYLSVKPAGKR